MDARKICDILSPEAKAIILQHPPPDPNLVDNTRRFQKPFPPHRIINQHDVDYLLVCLHDLHGGSQPQINSEDTEVEDAISASEDQDKE